MSRPANFVGEDAPFVGEDKTLRFYIVTGPDIRLTADVTIGATSLAVEPIKEALVSTQRLRFEGIVLIVGAAGAAIGARSIPVAATTGYIPRAILGARIQDLTGFACKWTLRASSESTVDILSKTTVSGITIVSTTDGVLDVALSAANLTIAAKRYYHILGRTDTGNVTLMAYGDFDLRRIAA